MNKELEAFLQEGIKRYSSAINTVEQFQTKAGDELEGILRKRISALGGPAVPFNKDSFRGKPGRAADWGNWIYSRFIGKLAKTKNNIELEVGIWWEPPELSLPVIFYAGVMNEDNDKYAKAVIKNKRLFPYDKWLCVDPSPEVNIERDLNELLDEIVRQLENSGVAK